MLLISAESADPYSTIVVDPKTGVSAWSFKGSELQGGAASSVVPLGNSGDVLMIPIKDRPILHAIAVHNKDRYHIKTVVGGPISSLCTNSDGSLVFAGIKTQIFVWLLTSGELLSVTDAFYQNITKILLSDDDSYLFAISKDGSINVYLVVDLLSVDRGQRVNPIRTWSAHSNNVMDIAITQGLNPRIVTCGMDHVAFVHSISLNTALLKVSADRPLTSCTIDAGETRIFLGTDNGNIAQINLYTLDGRDELLIQTADDKDERFPVFHGHSAEIKRLAVNNDSTLLASGDIEGKYCIWDIVSRQCLKVSTLRGAISTLQFIPNWITLSSKDITPLPKPTLDLEKGVSTFKQIPLNVSKSSTSEATEFFNDLADGLAKRFLGNHGEPQIREVAITKPIETSASSLKRTNSNSVKTDSSVEYTDEEKIRAMVEENKKLKAINAQMYDFVAKELLQ
ncbi:unnamed protein product [Auanema sp. JU1783]|nr:unnamed protein product [Auanema sp. JU1783]